MVVVADTVWTRGSRTSAGRRGSASGQVAWEEKKRRKRLNQVKCKNKIKIKISVST